MRIDRYIAQNRVIDLKSTDFKGALSELLNVFDLSKDRKLTKKGLLRDLLDREKQMTTYLRQRCVFASCASADEAQLYDRCGALSEWVALRWAN